MTKGDKKLEEAYVEEAPREEDLVEEENEEDLDRNLGFSSDMRVYYRKMSSHAYEMYKKRKHEVVEGGVSENIKAEELARAANAAVTKLKRGAYREWCDTMDLVLEKVATASMISEIPKIRDKDTTEELVVSVHGYLSAESLRKISVFVGEIMGQYWLVELAYREFVEIAGETE